MVEPHAKSNDTESVERGRKLMRIGPKTPPVRVFRGEGSIQEFGQAFWSNVQLS